MDDIVAMGHSNTISCSQSVKNVFPFLVTKCEVYNDLSDN